jgi:hypothetical protein
MSSLPKLGKDDKGFYAFAAFSAVTSMFVGRDVESVLGPGESRHIMICFAREMVKSSLMC